MAKLITTILLLSATTLKAYAVIPSLISPLQGFIAILPQILIIVVAALGTIFSLKMWRARLSKLKTFIAGHKALTVVILLVLIGGFSSGMILLSSRSDRKPRLRGTASGEGFPESWPTFRGDVRRTGNPTDGPGPINSQIAWAFEDDEFRFGDFSSSPAPVEGKVYVGSAQAMVFSSFGVVYCLNADDGGVIWKFKTKREIFSSPAVANGRVYIGEGLHRDVDSRLYCLDAETGELLWDFQTDSHVESSPTVVEDKVVFGGGEDGVYCLNAETGELIWHFDGIHVDLSPAVADGKVLIGTGYGDMGVYCLNLEDGELIWRHRTKYPVWGSPSVYKGRAYFGVGNGNFVESDPNPYGALLCLDLKSGDELWSYKVGDSVLTAPAVVGDRVYFGSRDGRLYCVDAKKGDLIWRYDAGSPVLSSPAVAGEFVYLGSQNGKIYALDRIRGDLRWAFDIGVMAPSGTKVLSSPAVADGRIYIGCSKGMLFSIGEGGNR